MPADNESKRRVALLAIGLFGLAVLVVVAGFLYPRWTRQRERERALEEFAIDLDRATLEFGRCVTGTDDSSAYGRSLLEQLRTREFESDYKPALEACDKAYAGQIELLRERVATFPQRDSSTLYLLQPMLEPLCGALVRSHEYRDDFFTELGLDREALPAIDCEPSKVEARPLDLSRLDRKGWAVHEPRSGEFVVVGGDHDAPQYARVERDGALTWFVPPAGLEPVGSLQITAKQPFLLNYKPQAPSELMLGTWPGASDDPEHFEQRRLNADIPHLVFTSPERWFFVQTRYDSLELQFSDDEGTSFTRVHVPFPRQSEKGVAQSFWGYVEGKRLTLLAVREPSASDTGEAQPSLLFVVRVDDVGALTTTSVDYDHNHKSIDLYACATPAGVFATIGEHLLIHAGDTPTIVHDFAEAKTRALACQGERAFVVVDDGAALQRFVCTGEGCGDAALLTRQAKVAVSLRATPTGIRAAVLNTTSDADLYIVDEPLGGPLERIDQLVFGQPSYSAPPVFVDGMLHAGATRAEHFYMRAPTDADR